MAASSSLRAGAGRLARRLATAAAAPPSGMSLAGAGVFGSMVFGTFGLGSWQVSRYYWKLDLLDRRVAALGEPPMALPARRMLPDGGAYTRETLTAAAPEVRASAPSLASREARASGPLANAAPRS